MEETPVWKRARDDIIGHDSPPNKRQKPLPEPFEDPLTQLQNALKYVESARDIGEEAKRHAQELSRLLFDNGTSASIPVGATNGSESAVMASSGTDHTIVPPPFYASNVEVFMKSEPSSTGSEAGSNRVPPLPPIKDLTLLSAPFTHTSTLAAYITPSNTNTYEPLEFLGDAYLEIIATRLIHNFFPSHTVGQKSGLREILIRNDTLFQYAKDYGFGDRVQVSGIDPSQRAWIKVLADVFEAYVACVILSDNQYGFQTAETWLAALWQPKIREWRKFGDGKNPAPSGVISMDVKSELQRMTVSKGVKLEYLEEKPMEHIKEGNRTTFFMGVYISGWDYNKRKLGSGSGKNKQLASAEAAKDAFISGRAIVERAHQMKLAFDQQNVQIAKLNGKANGKRTR